MKVYNNILEMVGETPYLRYRPTEGATIYLKLEAFNPGGSVKDRAALGMIERAEADGRLKPGMTIVEPTSGNTGIALAMIGRQKGYKVIITMPETMSKERRDILRAYGAEILLTPGASGMKGAIEKATEMAGEDANVFMPGQFDNRANPDAHYRTTGPEIFRDVPGIRALVVGVGTGGTLTGVGSYLKEQDASIQLVAVEPENSPVLTGGNPGPHKIQGIGAGFVPGNTETDLIDRIERVKDEEAFASLHRVRDDLGLLVGVSAGAAIAAATALSKEMSAEDDIVVVVPDNGMKYLSMGLY